MADTTLPGLLDSGNHAARPAASAVGSGGLYSCSDHSLIYQTDGSSWTTWASLTGTGAMATDALWDAAGDIAVGTGSNTGAKLTIGATGKVPTSNGTTLAYVYPSGYVFDYVQKTSDTTITATSGASATTVITGSAIAYDGSTEVIIEAYAPGLVGPSGGAGRYIDAVLYDGATELGILGRTRTASSGVATSTLHGFRKLTPSAATHTYYLKGYNSAGTDGIITGGDGTAGNWMPCFLRITKA